MILVIVAAAVAPAAVAAAAVIAAAAAAVVAAVVVAVPHLSVLVKVDKLGSRTPRALQMTLKAKPHTSKKVKFSTQYLL